jgi:hypothetical protein
MAGRRWIAVLAAALSTLLVGGCMNGAWKQALDDDTPAAYYRFLRDHPDSKYAEDARAHLEFHKIKRRPSLQAFAKFEEDFPQSPLLEELRPLLEEQAFEAARAAGTAPAYDQFVEHFPNGSFASRARGNAVYLENHGFQGRPAELAAFAAEHPESDFADEARRSAESLDLRDRSRFRQVGLRIQISPSTPQVDRLIQAFTQKAVDQYQAAGVTLVPVPEIVSQEQEAKLPTARLEIAHSEKPVESRVSGESMSRPGVDVLTRVTLRLGADGAPIWQRDFQLHVDSSTALANTSVLFGPTARRFWDSFFVPVATWQTRVAVRSPVQLAKGVAAVDAVGDRALVLFEDGDFQLLELSDPAKPVVLAEYQRDRDLKRWSGIRALGDRVAIFGPEGIELVRFTPDGTKAVAALGRGQIGSVVAVERMGENLLLAGNRGLILTQADAAEPVRLLRREIQGFALVGETLIFTDGDSVLVTSVPLLRENRVLAQLRLGRDFAPGRVRAFGSKAVVIGRTGVLVIDLKDARKPRVLSQLYTKNIGAVRDAVGAMGRIFLVGERGLQVLDGSDHEVVNSIDVASRQRVAPMGRHIVAVGEQDLQVVDTTPFVAASLPAKPAQPAAPAPMDSDPSSME